MTIREETLEAEVERLTRELKASGQEVLSLHTAVEVIEHSRDKARVELEVERQARIDAHEERDHVAKLLENSQAQVERLTRALEFYADPKNYNEDGIPGVSSFGGAIFDYDCRRRASEALRLP